MGGFSGTLRASALKPRTATLIGVKSIETVIAVARDWRSALRASQDLVYLQQERAQVTLGSVSDAVISASPDGSITYMNAAAEQLTGCSHDDAHQRKLAEVLIIATDPAMRSVTTQLDRIIAGEAVSGAADGVVLQRHYCPDDEEVQQRHGEMRCVERVNAALDGDGFVRFAPAIRPIGVPSAAVAALRRPRFEVLLRRLLPDGEQIAPMGFIPAAERYGLMPRIDRWVIARTCRELRRAARTRSRCAESA